MTRTVTLIVLAVLVGVGAGVAVFVLTDGDADEPIRVSDEDLDQFPRPQAPVVERFVDAWFVYRTGEFLIEFDVERERVSDGETLQLARTYAQLPPNRVVAGFGGVTGVLDGRPINCAGDQVDVDVNCVAGEATVDYDTMVTDERSAMLTYFEGDDPAYLVRVDPEGCFELLATRELASPPWGVAATFCFDEQNGAMTSNMIDRGSIVERSTATSVDTTVERSDLDVLIE